MSVQAPDASLDVYNNLSKLIGQTMNSEALRVGLVAMFGSVLPEPELKVYSDGVYLNYYTIGSSLFFILEKDYRPKSSSLDANKLRLKSIDVYNKRAEDGSKKQTFSTFPLLPLVLPTSSGAVKVAADTTGKDLVEALGEPPRKGGGDGPSSGSIDIWCEWPIYGIMAELDQRGPQAWERGKDASWKVLTIFLPTENEQ